LGIRQRSACVIHRFQEKIILYTQKISPEYIKTVQTTPEINQLNKSKHLTYRNQNQNWQYFITMGTSNEWFEGMRCHPYYLI